MESVESDVCQERRNDSTLRRALVRRVQRSHFEIPRLEPCLNLAARWETPDALQDVVMTDVVECSADVSVEHPFMSEDASWLFSKTQPQVLHGIVDAATWTEPVAGWFESSFPAGFRRCLDHILADPVCDRRDA